MTCPKCNKEAQAEWIYCPFCQNPLKEKCPECGEMERIGRLVCESKYKKAKDEYVKFMNNSRPTYEGNALIIAFCFLALSLVLALITGIANLFLENQILKKTAFICFFAGTFFSVLIAVIGLLLGAFLGPYSKKYRKLLEQKFLRLHQDYAEILEKAKTADAKSSGGQKEGKRSFF